jgi:hypothetical protein
MKIAVDVKTFTVGELTIQIGPIKGKHMVKAQRDGGPKAGQIEMGFRTLAAAMEEAMGADAPTYVELLEQPVKDIEPLLALISEG